MCQRTWLVGGLLALVFGTGGCADNDPGATAPAVDVGQAHDSGDGGQHSVDTLDSAVASAAADRFNPDRILDIHIELPASEWDALRKQVRDLSGFLKPKCHDAPYASPYTYRKAKVTVDGHTFVDAGVRKKGFVGSNDFHKPSLKIRFDKFVQGRTFGGVKRLTLNNNKQDRAEISQCMAYQVFARAGVPAPRCNFAHVRVNGVDLGLFTHVEGIRKAFIGERFDDDSGPLWEGTLSDFREGWTATFEAKNKAAEQDNSVASLTEALKLPDDQLLSALQKIVDLPGFMRFWAVESLIHHRDGYASNRNNFYVYRDPKTSLLHFLPWGTDNVLRPFEKRPPGMPHLVFAHALLARRLYAHPDGRKQYVAAMQAILAKAWDEKHLLAEVDRMAALVAMTAKLYTFPNAQQAGGSAAMATMLQVMRTFIQTRRAPIEAELKAAPSWPFPLTDKFCFELSVEATGTFASTMGTLNKGDPFKLGSGSITAKTAQGVLGPAKTGAMAGWNKENPDRLQLQMVFQHPTSPGLLVVMGLQVPKDEIVVDAPIQLGSFLAGGGGFLVTHNPATKQTNVVGLLWQGVVTFSDVGTSDGDAVVASWKGDFIPWGQGG